MAAAEVGTSPELLLMIAHDLANSLSILYNLCLVNRTFNGLFTPMLYRNVVLKRPQTSWEDRHEFMKSVPLSNLAHSKEITGFDWLDLTSLDIYLRQSDPYKLNTVFEGVIRASRGLEKFSGLNVQPSNRSLHILAESAVNLKSLILSFHPSFGDSIGIEIKSQHASESRLWNIHGPHFGGSPTIISAFRNLARIELLQLWGDIEPWVVGITKMLEQNRQVTSLALSRSHESHKIAALEVGRRAASSLLCRICDSFSHNDEALTLKLLHVGRGIDFPGLPLLIRLTNLQVLEDLAVRNNLGTTNGYNDTIGFSVPWTVIHPRHTPRLKIVTFSQFDESFWPHLDAICGDHGRPLDIKFMSMHLGDDNDDDDYDSDEEDEDHERAEIPDAYDIFRRHPGVCFAGLFLPFPPKRDLIPALESLRGCELQRLGLDLYQEWKRLRDDPALLPAACSVISSMPHLSAFHISISCRDEEEAEVKDIVKSVVTDIARANPVLKYIRLGPLSWRTRRSDEGAQVVLLNEMEDLQKCPEIFRTRQFGVATVMTIGPPHHRYWDILTG